MSYGEYWAYEVVEAVLNSPAWPRTLLIYTYDEHGGYYDHVPPPAAIAPDSIAPELGPEDCPAAMTSTARACPAIVVSPYSKPNAVTERRPRPHLGARHDRGEVEPAGAHLPRRQRDDRHGLPRPRSARVARAADARPNRPTAGPGTSGA